MALRTHRVGGNRISRLWSLSSLGSQHIFRVGGSRAWRPKRPKTRLRYATCWVEQLDRDLGLTAFSNRGPVAIDCTHMKAIGQVSGYEPPCALIRLPPPPGPLRPVPWCHAVARRRTAASSRAAVAQLEHAVGRWPPATRRSTAAAAAAGRRRIAMIATPIRSSAGASASPPVTLSAAGPLLYARGTSP
jgi:hypothetical protein